jgi:rubrerythrin
MSFNLNANELFQIGVQFEINGQRFYERAAKNISDPSAKKVFSDLSRRESEYIELFKKLRTE